MREIIEKKLNSQTVGTIVLLITMFTGLYKLVGGVFPQQARIFGAIFLLIIGSYAIFVVWPKIIRFFKLIEKIEDRILPDQVAYELMAQRYGSGYEVLDVKCNIFGVDRLQIDHAYRIKAFSRLSQLDHYLSLESSNQDHSQVLVEIVDAPPSNVIELNIPMIPANKSSSNKPIVSVNIADPLSEGSEIAYTLRQKLNEKFYGIDAEDFFAWSINRPTKQLILSIIFPNDLRPRDHESKVWVASVAPELKSERNNIREKVRIGEPQIERIEERIYKLQIKIDYPMVGLIYVISWKNVIKQELI